MKQLRSGYTTSTCAAAAAKAAVRCLLGQKDLDRSNVTLPDGESVDFPVVFTERGDACASAGVRKDAGDDPDDTNGVVVVVEVSWQREPSVVFAAGSGVGTVTKQGLSIPVGEPAINPVPRRMIQQAIRQVTRRGVRVRVSIPGGETIARKTFNPRLGIKGGLSILGTTGRVVPFSCPAFRESLRCLLRVADGSGVTHPILVPGNIGVRAAERHFRYTEDALITVANEWGYMLREASTLGFSGLLCLGHPGKLAKLIDGHFQTHSKSSPSALPVVQRFADALGLKIPDSVPTVEGCFAYLEDDSRNLLSVELAMAIQNRVAEKLHDCCELAVALIDMRGSLLGTVGDLSSWRT